MIDGYLTVQYEDSAPPYDPLARLSTVPPDRVVSIDEPATDGLGIRICR